MTGLGGRWYRIGDASAREQRSIRTLERWARPKDPAAPKLIVRHDRDGRRWVNALNLAEVAAYYRDRHSTG